MEEVVEKETKKRAVTEIATDLGKIDAEIELVRQQADAKIEQLQAEREPLVVEMRKALGRLK